MITDATTNPILQGAIFTVNGKTATSVMEGMAEISKTKPGTYQAKFSLTNYASQDVKIVIERGRVTEIEVKLAK